MNGALLVKISMVCAVAILPSSFTIYPNSKMYASYESNNNCYFVAPYGDDRWSGKIAEINSQKTDGPFLTIQKAADVMKPGDTCFIRKGIYRETIVPSNSGNPLGKMVFSNYKGEKVVISGCDLLNRQWERVSDSGIYKTFFDGKSKEDMFFIDGKLANNARWPNATNDLLRPAFASVDSGTSHSLTDMALPENLSLKGCVLNGLFGKEWTMQTMIISSFDSRTKTMFFSEPARRSHYYGGQSGWDHNYAPRKGNRYYISGSIGLTDQDGEWYYDDSDKMLFLCSRKKVDPSERKIEVKARNYAFDLSGRSYIEIRGLEIFGAGIKSDSATHDCLITKVKGRYVDPGIFINGNHNEVNSCDFSFCGNAIMTIDGERNRIINNYMHDGDYNGTGDQLMDTKGTHLLVSHNTISGSGGGGIGPGGSDNRFQYNDISDAGLIRHDIGGFYVADHSGGYSVIDHNRVHDIDGIGIYLDNSTSHYIIHHNVIWNCGWEFLSSKPPPPFVTINSYDAIRLNTPSNFNLVYNNTCYNKFGMSYWGRNFKEDMYGDFIVNNIFTGSYHVSENAVSYHNLYAKTDPVMQNPGKNDFHLTATSPAIDKGVILTPVTDGFRGKLPDCGAYEYGNNGWDAGYDFSEDPHPHFVEVKTDYMDLIKNGGFETGDFSSWRITNDPFARIIKENSWGKESANTRTQNNSLRLGKGMGEVSQTIHSIKSGGQYVVSGWFKVSTKSVVAKLMIDCGNGKQLSKSVNSTEWKFLSIAFTTSAHTDSVTVYISKPGNNKGFVYCDDVGLLLQLEK